MKNKHSAASRAAYQHDMDVESSTITESADHSDLGAIYGSIDMPAHESYRLHTTNFGKPPQKFSLIPMKLLVRPNQVLPNNRVLAL